MSESRPNEARQGEAMESSDPPLIEPEIVQVLSVSGLAVEVDDHLMHFVGWIETPAVGGDSALQERRIVLRFDMSRDHFQQFWAGVAAKMPKGH